MDTNTPTGQRFTAVGFWEDDQVVLTGYIPGEHNVYGGDSIEQGLFADAFTVNVDDPTDEDAITAALHAAIAAAYYGDLNTADETDTEGVTP